MLDETLVARLSDAVPRAFAGRHLLVAYAFGSRVNGRALPDSDLDIGYYLEGYRAGEALSISEEMSLAAQIGRAVGFQVDLRNLAEASLEFRGRVLEQGVRVHTGDAAARVALERELLARYHDYKAEIGLMHERRLRTIAQRGL